MRRRISCAAFRYPSSSCATWPGGDPSLCARRRSWGSFPSQVCSRGWVDPPDQSGGLASGPGGISVGPGPRAFCACHPPRLIFVGVADRLWEKEIFKSDRSGMTGVGFRASLPSAVRIPGARRSVFAGRGPILPWALPLAGLAGDLLRIRVVSTPPRITSLRNNLSALPRPGSLLSAHGFEASFAGRSCATCELLEGHTFGPCTAHGACCLRFAVPSAY
jgi:hypothetical protein